MEYLHTMVRISNVEESLDFYCNKLHGKARERRAKLGAIRTYSSVRLERRKRKGKWSQQLS